jgi:cytochrome c oxidase assembly factor CtaG
MSDDRPPFDPIKAAFYLVALVLLAHVVVVLAAVGVCIWHSADIVAGNFKCDSDGHLFELLGAALSAALAFAGGMMRGGPPNPPNK